MVKKKKLVIKLLKKHGTFDVWYDNDRDGYTSVCNCGYEKQGINHEDVDDLHARHVYSMIKTALKKRKKVQAFYAPAVTMPPTNIF